MVIEGHMAWCAQPKLSAIARGTFRVSDVLKDTEISLKYNIKTSRNELKVYQVFS